MKKAIEYLKNTFFKSDSDEQQEHLAIAIASLYKQEPISIIFDNDDLNICPICQTPVKTDDKYCSYCGHAICLEIN